MRTLVSFLVLLVGAFAWSPGYADAPKTLNYQGYLTDNAGTPISGSRALAFKLYSVSTGGAPLWTETLPAVTITNGLYQVVLGSVTALTLPFDTQYYLGVTVGTDPELAPRQPLTSTPYALGLAPGSSVTLTNSASTSSALTISSNNAQSALAVTKTGSGSAGSFNITDQTNSYSAVYGYTAGSGAGIYGVALHNGYAGRLYTAGAENSKSALLVETLGIGNAGTFIINNTGSAANSIEASVNGVGSALKALTTGTGAAARIEIDNPNNVNPALSVTTDAKNVALAVSNMGSENAGAAWIVVANSNNSAPALHSAHYGYGRAVYGDAVNGVGVVGESGHNTGVWGIADEGLGVDGSSVSGVGVKGRTGNNIAVYGVNSSTDFPAVEGWNQGTGDIFRGWSGSIGSQTKKFYVTSSGALVAVSKSFRIDHPLDPKNRYLNHVSVESPDMKNLYDGVLTTDDKGLATVLLPAWFEALNKDFRYQLTVLGDGVWARARILKELADNRFVVQTDLPNIRVSWQLTGIRKDAWAQRNRIPVEQDKPVAERGTCLEPSACQ